MGTIILGSLWGGWHLPLFLTTSGGWPNVTWAAPVEFVIICILLSIVMTWVFNRTRGSVPLIMLLHSSINTVFSALWPAVFPGLDFSRDTAHVLLLTSAAGAALLLAATRGLLGLPQHGRTEDDPEAKATARQVLNAHEVDTDEADRAVRRDG